MNHSVFESEEIYLAAPDPEADAEIEAGWTMDAEYLHLLGLEPAYPLTAAQVKRRYEDARKDGSRDSWFAVRLRADDRLLGFIRFMALSWPHQLALLKFGIGNPADRGRGYGHAILRLALAYAFDELGLHRLVAPAPTDNLAAQRLLTQAAFSLDVRMRDMLRRNGRRSDLLHYGLLQREWRQGQADMGGVARSALETLSVTPVPPLRTPHLFHGDQVRLGVVTPDLAAPRLAAWTRQAEYLRMLDSDPARPSDSSLFREDLGREQTQNAQRRTLDEYWFLIHRLSDDRPIGFVSVNGIAWTHGNGWVSIGIGEMDCWGQGFGTDAMRVLLRYAFEELNLQRLSLNVFSYNERGRRSYLKTGFTTEGIGRESLLRNGQRWDEYFMGILREEWQAAASA